MKHADAHELVSRELRDLGVSPRSMAYSTVLEQALAAAEVMGRTELVTYIEDYLDSLPDSYFRTYDD